MPSRKNSAAFDRCVKAVSKRPGVRSPGGVCAASERRRGLMNPSRKWARSYSVGTKDFSTLKAAKKYAQDWANEEGREVGVTLYASRPPASTFVGRSISDFKERTVYMKPKRGNPLPLAAAQALEGSALAPYQKKATKEVDGLRKKLGLKLNKGRKRKNPGNPADGAAAAYEGFHGRPSEEVIVIDTKIHEHKHVAALGELVALYVIPLSGSFEVKISGFGKGKRGAWLTMNEARTQLFIDGGDQRVDLADFGIKSPVHESEVLGVLSRIDYYTVKDHLGDQGGEAIYNHRIPKRGRPFLTYDTRNGLLYVSGGDYTLPNEGITN